MSRRLKCKYKNAFFKKITKRDHKTVYAKEVQMVVFGIEDIDVILYEENKMRFCKFHKVQSTSWGAKTLYRI